MPDLIEAVARIAGYVRALEEEARYQTKRDCTYLNDDQADYAADMFLKRLREKHGVTNEDIAALAPFQDPDAELIEAMADAIANSAPDDYDIWRQYARAALDAYRKATEHA